MNFGMIASGGIGSRMGCKIPKQFLKLGEKPILAYSIEKFLNVCEIDFLCVSTPKIWFFETESLVNKYFKKFKDKIHVVCGGETRNETILNMINYAEKNLSNQSELDFAVTHDAARPFVTEKMIRKSLEIAKTGKVCTFGEKINDTVVETKDNKMVEKFLNREKIVKIQTPQTFDMREFKRLYGELTDIEKSQITDCTGVFFAKNIDVEIIFAETVNPKITTRTDYELFQLINSDKSFFSNL